MVTLLVCCLLAALSVARGQQQICCDGIGCFSEAPPFDHLPLPDCPSSTAPNFNLFTRQNRNNAASITRSSIPSQFAGRRRTVFIIHGFTNDRSTQWMHDLKNTFLDNFDYNVIIVGWGDGAITIDYPWAASNTRVVGAESAFISNNLISQRGAAASRIWCVGHSLGAQACGHFGKRLRIGRITGLDPAGPLFDGYAPAVALSPNDANFVDTIQTNAGVLGSERGNMGHANFFPNNGDEQPGCDNDVCDHGVCRDYFRESLSGGCRFNARQRCTSATNLPGSCSDCGGVCQVMGEPAEGNGGRGIFILTTNANPPRCRG